MGQIGSFSIGGVGLPVTLLRDPPTVVITAPVGTIATSTVTVTWTYSSPLSRTQAGYRVVLQSLSGGGFLFDTGLLEGSATSYALGYTLAPFNSYRILVGVSDGLDGAENPILFSPGWDFADFFTEFDGAVSYDNETRVGSVYEIGINGVGYMLADHPEKGSGYKAQIVHLDPQRLATGDTPFSEAIERYTFIAHSNWTSGTGQTYLNRTNSDPDRYYYSEWVNPFEMGELTCLETPDQHIASTYASVNTSQTTVVASGDAYVQTGNAQLTSIDEPGGTTTVFSTGSAGVLTDLASDGVYWYATDGATIRRNSSAADPAADWSTVDVTAIEWVGDRLAGLDTAAAAPNFTTFDSAGAEEVPGGRFAFAGATLKGVTGGDGYVWWGVNRGDTGVVHAWQLDSVDGAFIALQLPAGETVDNLYFYLGNVFLATRTEANFRKIYRCVPAEGRLTPAFLVETLGAFQHWPIQFAGHDRFVAFTWYCMMRSPESGIGVVDLESGGFARWYAAGGPTASGLFGQAISGVVRWADDFAFTVTATTGTDGGFYGAAETTALHEGFLETSVADLASNVTKVLDTLSLTTKPLNGSVELFYSTDTNGSFTSLGTMSGAATTATSLDAAVYGTSFGFRLVLTPDGETGPTVKLLSAKTHPQGLVDKQVQLVINCADRVTGLNGQELPESAPGAGIARARTLSSLVGQDVQLQDIDWPITGQSDVLQVMAVEVSSTGVFNRLKGRREDDAVAQLTLRGPA